MKTARFSPSLHFLGQAEPGPEAAATDESAPVQPRCPLFLAPVKAGFPSPADDYVDEQINLHELLVRNPPATFFLRAAGDSMLGAGIHDGDLLIVDRSVDAGHGRIVIAALEGELTVKRLERRHDRVYLTPANDAYPPIDITEREYVHIWGVVTHVIHKL